MSRLLRHPWFQTALAVVLGGVFIAAAAPKIQAPAEFARIVYHYPLIGPTRALGPMPSNLIAVVLPWIELILGLLLVAGVWRREAALLSGLLLVGFIGLVSLALAQNIDLENCGCFSVSGEGRAAGTALLLGDLALLAMAGVLVFGPRAANTARATIAEQLRPAVAPAPATDAGPASGV